MARPQLQPREDREVFVVPLDVRPEHIDENNHVNNVVYVGWLQDEGLRDGIKSFTDWPTIPQLYVKGEFVGGCDIVTEMTLSGELDELLTRSGVAFDKDAAEKIREANR